MADQAPARPYFSFVCAENEADLEEAYRIRYQVYCLERGFLDKEDYSQELEQDEFDVHAVHILASHRQGVPAGTARLVLHSDLGFPVARHCEFSPGHEFLKGPSSPVLTRFAEISRLAVSKVFRRRQGDTLYGGPPRSRLYPSSGADVAVVPTPHEMPEIVAGIIRLLYQESKRRGIQHWVVAMEQSLRIVLRRMGFRFAPIGPRVDYFGPVRPYTASVEGVERYLERNASDVLRYIAAGLEPHLLPPCLAGQARWSGD